MDNGRVKLVTDKDIREAEYNSSLETMETIQPEERCVVIAPHMCKHNHLILVDEFIRSNLKGEFKNPYTRNVVDFPEDDLRLLQEKRKEFIKNIKNDLHEIFVQFLEVLRMIQRESVEILYFSEIAKIFNVILSALPFFEELENAFGNYNDNYGILYKEIKTQVIKSIETFEKDIKDEPNMQQIRELVSFMTIPDEMKEIIRYIFSNFLNLLTELSEIKAEFDYKNILVGIFTNLDDIHCMYTTFGTLSNMGPIDTKIQLILCMIEDEIEKLRATIRA